MSDIKSPRDGNKIFFLGKLFLHESGGNKTSLTAGVLSSITSSLFRLLSTITECSVFSFQPENLIHYKKDQKSKTEKPYKNKIFYEMQSQCWITFNSLAEKV